MELNNQKINKMEKNIKKIVLAVLGLAVFAGCKPKTTSDAISGDAAQKVYVAPGEHDEF